MSGSEGSKAATGEAAEYKDRKLDTLKTFREIGLDPE